MDRRALRWLDHLPAAPRTASRITVRWRGVVEAVAPGVFKPFAQSFYVELE